MNRKGGGFGFFSRANSSTSTGAARGNSSPPRSPRRYDTRRGESSWGQLTSQWMPRNKRRRAILAMTLLSILLVGSATVVYTLTQKWTRQVARENLRSILSANVSALELWFSDRQRQLNWFVLRDDLHGRMKRWLADQASPDSLRGDLNRQLLGRQGNASSSGMDTRDVIGWLILDGRGRVRLASHLSWEGDSNAELAAPLERCFREGNVIAPPIRFASQDETNTEAETACMV
ncbi:MAG: hypothetical protein AAF989_16135, partial [Planctomycetota bacterium]